MAGSNGHKGGMQFATLDDLGEVQKTFLLNTPAGKKLAITLRSLPQMEFRSITRAIPEPPEPFDIRRGANNAIERVPLTTGPAYEEYLQATSDRAEEIGYRLVAASITSLEIPGADIMSKTVVLRERLGFWAMQQLVREVNAMNGITAVQVEEEAENLPMATSSSIAS